MAANAQDSIYSDVTIVAAPAILAVNTPTKTMLDVGDETTEGILFFGGWDQFSFLAGIQKVDILDSVGISKKKQTQS